MPQMAPVVVPSPLQVIRRWASNLVFVSSLHLIADFRCHSLATLAASLYTKRPDAAFICVSALEALNLG